MKKSLLILFLCLLALFASACGNEDSAAPPPKTTVRDLLPDMPGSDKAAADGTTTDGASSGSAAISEAKKYVIKSDDAKIAEDKTSKSKTGSGKTDMGKNSSAIPNGITVNKHGIGEKTDAPENSKNTLGEKTVLSTEDGIDVDLASLSATVLYAEVYNILMNYTEFEGKTIRIKGRFTVVPNEKEGTNSFVIYVLDAGACCSMGFDFVLAGEHNYPDDYPEAGTEITVTGKFHVFKKDRFMYAVLEDAVMN